MASPSLRHSVLHIGHRSRPFNVAAITKKVPQVCAVGLRGAFRWLRNHEPLVGGVIAGALAIVYLIVLFSLRTPFWH